MPRILTRNITWYGSKNRGGSMMRQPRPERPGLSGGTQYMFLQTVKRPGNMSCTCIRDIIVVIQ
jgi:hypothetical protein